MRKLLRGFATGLLIGGLAGLWFGMNIGKEQPLLSNPFAEVSLSDRVDRTAEEAAEAVGEGAEQAGDAVQDSLDGQ
jgi:hypothetical protein